MSRKLTLPALALALTVGFSGCDLQVENPNQPDRLRALAGPDDVETLIKSSFMRVWQIGHYWNNSNFAFAHMSNRHTATWGNMGMNDLGRQPREVLPNVPSYRWAYVFSANWGDAYAGISGASDGIRAIDAGLEIGPGGERNARAKIFGQMNQAILSCLLALWYDQAFIVDETTDLGGDLETVPYGQVFDYAMAKLDAVESAARGATFTLDDDWVNGLEWSNTELADYVVKWKARCAANLPRSDAEAGSANWSQIMSNAAYDPSMRDANSPAGGNVVVTGENYRTSPWWDGLKSLMQENNTWHRMHMDWIGMADQSGEYQDWLMQPIEQRTARQLTFGEDMRFPPTNTNDATSDPVSPTVASDGPRVRYNSTIIFRPERGTYRQSHYGDMRYDAYTLSCSFCFSGPMEHMTAQEMDSYMAEGHYRMGAYAMTAEIVNRTRMEAGLPPAPSNATDPVPTRNGSCTPRKRYDVTGRCGNLRDAMWFEKFENVFNVFGGLEFWHGRRNDILPVGTALHLPIPAADLELLLRDVYTFGGVGGTSAAPDPTPLVIPGNLDSALERVSYALSRLQERDAASKRKADLVVR